MKIEELNESEINKIKDGFRYFDRKNTGYIRASDLGNALRYLKLIPTEKEIESFLLAAKAGQTGKISRDVFVSIAAKLWFHSVEDIQKHLWKAFEEFDKELTGYISSSVLKDILVYKGIEPIPEKEADKVIKAYEDPSSRKVEYRVLIHNWLK